MVIAKEESIKTFLRGAICVLNLGKKNTSGFTLTEQCSIYVAVAHLATLFY